MQKVRSSDVLDLVAYEKVREAMQKSDYAGVMGAKGMKYSFPEGKRAGFDPNGMVVRVYENDRQGRVLHVGQK